MIILQSGDPRIGELNADGSIKTWPKTDVHGAFYERAWASIKQVQGGFIVFGINKDGEEIQIVAANGQGKAEG
jgi:hypothetical protein